MKQQFIYILKLIPAFGVVIFEADSEEEARFLMETDPAVEEGIMTAELFPYRVALWRAKTLTS
ncbi:MAG: hypothetical protein GX228_10760 [Firmicutes bacterium]|nr:hypothetical protein [Bacillota bacterium]